MQKRGIDTLALVTQEDKEEFWEVVTSELLLEKESLDKIKELDPFEILLNKKLVYPFQIGALLSVAYKIQAVPLISVLHLLLLSPLKLLFTLQ